MKKTLIPVLTAAAAAALLSGCAYPGVELDTQVQQKQVLGEIYERTETWPFEKNPKIGRAHV